MNEELFLFDRINHWILYSIIMFIKSELIKSVQLDELTIFLKTFIGLILL